MNVAAERKYTDIFMGGHSGKQQSCKQISSRRLFDIPELKMISLIF
jgi:hypothetical protein